MQNKLKYVNRPYFPVPSVGLDASHDGLTEQSHKDECDVNQILANTSEPESLNT